MKAGGKRFDARLLHDAVEDSLFAQLRSPVMERLLENARQAASSNATILLTGESGTGKSLLARQIHLWSRRRAQRFSIIDCTRLSPLRDGSTLDAPSTSPASAHALLAGAEGGTVFLARVDELHPALQSGFARFVQDRVLQTAEGEEGSTCGLSLPPIVTSSRKSRRIDFARISFTV